VGEASSYVDRLIVAETLVANQSPPGVEAECETDRSAEQGEAAASCSPGSGNDIGGALPMSVIWGHDLVVAGTGSTLPIIASIQRHLGIPGLAPPDNPFYFGQGTHAPNEHIRLEDLEPSIRFAFALFDGLGARRPAAESRG